MPQERLLEQQVSKEICEVIMDISKGADSRLAGPAGKEGDIGGGTAREEAPKLLKEIVKVVGCSRATHQEGDRR